MAAEVGLSATRVHQILADRSAEIALQALSLLREVGWPAPEDSDAGEVVADRLVNEAALLTTCAEWLETLASGGPPPVINLRPQGRWPDAHNVAVDSGRLIRIIRRISSDIDELARARRIADVQSDAAEISPVLCHRRRLAEPPIEFPKGPSSIHQTRRAWDEYERQRQRAGLPVPQSPYRHLDRSAK